MHHCARISVIDFIFFTTSLVNCCRFSPAPFWAFPLLSLSSFFTCQIFLYRLKLGLWNRTWRLMCGYASEENVDIADLMRLESVRLMIIKDRLRWFRHVERKTKWRLSQTSYDGGSWWNKVSDDSWSAVELCREWYGKFWPVAIHCMAWE